ncbi:MAG: YaeQ family protein [Acidobacteriota bacterium]|nr:YaeQ family protein [Acidobacteriota bacterium]
MALTATIYNLDIDLADSDRNLYETLALRVAQHPSESAEYLVARILAYAMEFTEGIAFSRGICDPDDPAIAVRDLTGALRAWIDVGSPDAGRLHKASKLAPRVAVYTHKDVAQVIRNLAAERIHKAEALELYAIDRSLVAALAARLERRMAFSISINERELYISVGADTITGAVVRHRLDAG